MCCAPPRSAGGGEAASNGGRDPAPPRLLTRRQVNRNGRPHNRPEAPFFHPWGPRGVGYTLEIMPVQRGLVTRLTVGCVGLAGLWLAWSQAQQPAQLTIEKVPANLYVIVGSGGNVAVMP